MNFLSSVLNKVTESLSSSANHTVVALTRSSLAQLVVPLISPHNSYFASYHVPIIVRAQVVAGDGVLKLYQTGQGKDVKFLLVLSPPGSASKNLRIFIMDKEEEATRLYTIYYSNLLPIASVCANVVSSIPKLQVKKSSHFSLSAGVILTVFIC